MSNFPYLKFIFSKHRHKIASADFSSDYVGLILSNGAMTNEKTQESIRLATSSPLPPFNCKVGPLTTARPTSVHALRPSDIDAIGAIGDSLTAANGAKANTILGLLEECRGQAWRFIYEYKKTHLYCYLNFFLTIKALVVKMLTQRLWQVSYNEILFELFDKILQVLLKFRVIEP